MNDISPETARILIDPRCEAIWDALRQFNAPEATELDAAAATIACLRVAISIKLYIHGLFPDDARVQPIGIAVNRLITEEIERLEEGGTRS